MPDLVRSQRPSVAETVWVECFLGFGLDGNKSTKIEKVTEGTVIGNSCHD